jgi:hypothetical protein
LTVHIKVSRLIASLAIGVCVGALSSNHSVAAHEDHAHHAHATAASAQSPDLPALAARYAVRSVAKQGDWYLSRSATRIETANTDSGQNEIWEQNAPEQFLLTRIFHADQRIVEYTPGELKTRHAEPDWAQLASIVPPQWLSKLKRSGSKQIFGQTATHYRGRIGAEQFHLWWLEKSQLPASLTRSGPKGRIVLQLKELHAQAPAAWPLISETKIASYGKIDASDFGDMESDPFVARLLQQEGHEHGHAH